MPELNGTEQEADRQAEQARADIWTGRHPSVAHFKPLFGYDHLPPHLQEISGPCADLAAQMVANLPDEPELSAGLRKLLEAKDCFVRALVTR